MQKQHANTRMMATNAMETMAHDGTGGRGEQKEGQLTKGEVLTLLECK